jgi:hypothetical protein
MKPDPQQVIEDKISWFATEMLSQLQTNLHKGGWEQSDMGELLWLLDKASKDLTEVIYKEPADAAITKAADVANFAMMIADRLRGLK